jgi:hypothetical protein
MTKKIAAVLALSLVASNAFASQARNIVSGGGDGGNIFGGTGMFGSFYTNDEYNMFWNPAFINGQGNWAIIENGAGSGTSAGFVTDVSNFNLGVFLNRPTGTSNGASQAVDVILGGDMGVKWGVGLTQTLSTGGPSFTKVNAGVVVSDFEPFINYTLTDSDGATPETKDSTMMVGTRYHYGDWTPYAAYMSSKATTAGVEAAESANRWGLGLGRAAKMGEISMNYAVSYWRNGGALASGSVVPVEMTFAADAASWLTVRAGFQHNLMTRGAAAAGTVTSIGGTVKMGKADLDMVVGQNDGTGAAGTGFFGFSSGLFANAGLTYRW